MKSSTPNVKSFIPLPQQADVIYDIRKRFDYSRGVHEVMLSGSVGSSKSLLLAHFAVTHCLFYENARFGIGRLALPQLKQTLCIKIREHLFESGVDYRYNQSTGSFRFNNGSTIPTLSWADGNMEKLGSYEFSGFGIEELTETKTPDAYNTLKQRVGRLPHVPEQILISATNPDAPSHWAYKRIIEKSMSNDLINVYYSNTMKNPYLPQSYIDNLKDTLDERMVRRMVYGEWIEIATDVVYYSYDQEKHFINKSYKVNASYPIIVSWDFNIGRNKPLSLCLIQYIQGVFHIFNQVVVQGQRTEDSCEELLERGLLDYKTKYLIHGDATGRHKDTRSPIDDWEIVDRFFANTRNNNNLKMNYSIEVPRSNPRIRQRHNTVNGVLLNSRGKIGMYIYKDAPTAAEGLRLTRLRAGAQYLEDDSDSFQHITTAIGYAVCEELKTESFEDDVTMVER